MTSSTSSSTSSTAVDDKNVQELSMESAERKVWLVKLPDFVFNRIADLDVDDLHPPRSHPGHHPSHQSIHRTVHHEREADDGGMEIGTVRIHPPSDGAPARVVVLLDEEGPCGDLPREYDLRFSRIDHQQLHMLAEHEGQGHPHAIAGRVEQECHLRPVLTSDYRQVLQARQQQMNHPSRSVQFVDAFSGSEAIGLGLPRYVNESVLADKWKRRLGVDPAQRRDRLPQEDLLNVLFHLFERQTHWSLAGLLEQTKQPMQYLKDTLAQIATYNVRGPYKNLYELKAEFQKHSSS
jgi:transcription initiation factor TFIIF subunit beta